MADEFDLTAGQSIGRLNGVDVWLAVALNQSGVTHASFLKGIKDGGEACGTPPGKNEMRRLNTQNIQFQPCWRAR